MWQTTFLVHAQAVSRHSIRVPYFSALLIRSIHLFRHKLTVIVEFKFFSLENILKFCFQSLFKDPIEVAQSTIAPLHSQKRPKFGYS